MPPRQLPKNLTGLWHVTTWPPAPVLEALAVLLVSRGRIPE
jgi:hypothetical protein